VSNVPKCPMCIDCPITLKSFIVLLLKIVYKLVNFPKLYHHVTSSNPFVVQFPYIHQLPMSPSSFIGSISQMPNLPKYIHLSHWNPISLSSWIVPLPQSRGMGSMESGYLSTLTNLTLIILFLEMLKFLKFISSKSKNIVKDNSEYFGLFYLLKLINYLTEMCWNGQGTTIHVRQKSRNFLKPCIGNLQQPIV